MIFVASKNVDKKISPSSFGAVVGSGDKNQDPGLTSRIRNTVKPYV
jgi:hypothetical protein